MSQNRRRRHRRQLLVGVVAAAIMLSSCASDGLPSAVEPDPQASSNPRTSETTESHASEAPGVEDSRVALEDTPAGELAREDSATSDSWSTYERRLGFAAERCRMTEQEIADAILFHIGLLEEVGRSAVALNMLTDVLLFYVPAAADNAYDCSDVLTSWHALQRIEQEMTFEELADFCRFVSTAYGMNYTVEGALANRAVPVKLFEDNIRAMCASR